MGNVRDNVFEWFKLLVPGIFTGVVLLIATPLIAPVIAAKLQEPTCADPRGLTKITEVAASGAAKPSEQREQREISYQASNLVDGNTSTAWVENAPGLGVGSAIRFEFKRSVDLRLLCVVNGYGSSWSAYIKNSRVRLLKVSTDAGSTQTVLSDSGTPDHPSIFQQIQPPAGTTKAVDLTIQSAYAAQVTGHGGPYADTCLSEAEFWYD